MAPLGVEMVAAPIVWLTDAVVPDSGRSLYQLRRPCSQRGLVPILLSGMEGDETRPWDSHEFSPTDPRRVDRYKPDEVLGDMWKGCFDAEDEQSFVALQPFGPEFPGMAPPPVAKAPSGFSRLFSQVSDPDDDRAPLATLHARRIGLIGAGRPADAVTAVGWTGAVNVHQDPVLMSAVLRSWEDRWAARVVEIGFDTLTLTVGNPPRDRQEALPLAAEHFAFCPDNIWQGSDTIGAYARLLPGIRLWRFWWD